MPSCMTFFAKNRSELCLCNRIIIHDGENTLNDGWATTIQCPGRLKQLPSSHWTPNSTMEKNTRTLTPIQIHVRIQTHTHFSSTLLCVLLLMLAPVVSMVVNIVYRIFDVFVIAPNFCDWHRTKATAQHNGRRNKKSIIYLIHAFIRIVCMCVGVVRARISFCFVLTLIYRFWQCR